MTVDETKTIASVSGMTNPTPRPERVADDVLARVEEAAAKLAGAADRSAKSRREMASVYRDGSDDEWRAGAELAERQSGRRVQVTTPAERARMAEMHDAIAAKAAAEAEALSSVTALAADLRATREELRVLREAVRAIAKIAASNRDRLRKRAVVDDHARHSLVGVLNDVAHAALRTLGGEEGQG